MSNSLITPRTMSGFRDFLPEMMIPRERLMETARQVYRKYGFSPIDTPTLEYAEILTGKGSDETDHHHDFNIAGDRRCTDSIKIALSKLAEPTGLGTFASPYRGDVVTLEWHAKIVLVLSHESRQWNG